MVRLFRGRGRGLPRPPLRPMRPPNDFHPDFLPPFALQRGGPRPGILRGHPRPGLPGPPLHPPPRMRPPPMGRPMNMPPHPIDAHRPIPIPMRPPHPMDRPMPLRRPGRPLPPPIPARHMLTGPPMRRPMRGLRGMLRGQRGGLLGQRGVKRLGTTNGRAKKPRKEKTEEVFFCETCDRSLKTQEKLDEHLSQHETCGRDGCTFTAHPKLIEKHVQFQHESGLYNRIRTENPSDLAKWIADRKSRYPTRENVEQKKAQENEMVRRGERMPRNGKPFERREKGGSWKDNKLEKRQRKEDKLKRPKLKQDHPPQNLKREDNVKWRDPDAWRGDLPQFPGTDAFPARDDDKNKDDNNAQFSDDEDSSLIEKAAVTNKPSVSGVLAAIMLNYGSDISDEDDDDVVNNQELVSEIKEPQIIISSHKLDLEPLSNNSSVTFENNTSIVNESVVSNCTKEDSDCGPEEIGIDRVDRSNVPNIHIKEDSSKLKESKGSVPHKLDAPKQTVRATRSVIKKHKLSLLEKLLKNEIRHERNAILQCVRYVIQNNFFGSGNNKVL